jgi:hypothetical protein
MAEGQFWFRLPDTENMLMSLKPAELRCYLVVMRDIQRAQYRGLISARQVSDRTNLSLRHAHAALENLVKNGHLNCEKRTGATTRFSMPFEWGKQSNCSPVGKHQGSGNCSPVGEQSEQPGEQLGEQQRSPAGEQNCSPVGEQHLEYSDYSAKRVSSSSAFSESAREEEEVPLLLSLVRTPSAGSWSDADLERASTRLEASKSPFKVLPKLDFQIVHAITDNLIDLRDLDLWLSSSLTILQSRNHWGGWVTESKRWAERRNQTASILANAPPPQPRAAEETAPPPPQPICGRCGRDGIRQDERDPEKFEWCECIHASLKRAAHPDLIDRVNARQSARRMAS